MSTDERLEHYTRLGLLAIAVLHWIVFLLMIGSSERPVSKQTPSAPSNLAMVLGER